MPRSLVLLLAALAAVAWLTTGSAAPGSRLDTAGPVAVVPSAVTLPAAASTSPAGRRTAHRDGVPALSSRPGAPLTIYLDFTGARVSGTYWNDTYAHGDPIVAPPFSDPRDPGPGFTARERHEVHSIWAGVAAAFAMWEVDVTTVEPSPDDLTRSSADDSRYGTRVVITPTDVLQPGCHCSSGRAELDLWSVTGTDNAYRSVAWVFADAGWNRPELIAALAAHEVGHNFGLRHDGVDVAGKRHEYYTGSTPWSPIMGSPFDEPLHQWSDGDYAGATEHQDDLAVISRWAAPVPDDHVALLGLLPLGAGRTPDLEVGAGRPADVVRGLIGVRTGAGPDVDLLALRTDDPGRYRVDVAPVGPDSGLDAAVEVLDPLGTVLRAVAPATRRLDAERVAGTGASLTLELGRGTHVLQVRGTSSGPGTSAYGSVGEYRVRVTRIP